MTHQEQYDEKMAACQEWMSEVAMKFHILDECDAARPVWQYCHDVAKTPGPLTKRDRLIIGRDLLDFAIQNTES